MPPAALPGPCTGVRANCIPRQESSAAWLTNTRMENVKSENACRVTRADIVQGLSSVGVRSGDVVFVHSSLSSFGYVEDGADTVIDALLEAVDATGTVAVPTFTWGDFHDKTGVTFDMRSTPSETGRITEVFRRRPAAIRSAHICHSVAAIGPHAPALTRDTPSVFGPEGPFATLIELNAWNLFLGVSFGCCTALHAVEETMRVPYRKHRDFRDCTVIHPDGTTTPSISTEYLREPGYFNDFPKMGAVFAAHNVLHTATVGNATITNVRIRDVIDIATRLLSEDINYLLRAECRPK